MSPHDFDKGTLKGISNQQLESLLHMQRDILETALFSMDFQEMLSQLCLAIELRAPGGLAAIIELKAGQQECRLLTAPSLSAPNEVIALTFNIAEPWLNSVIEQPSPTVIQQLQTHPHLGLLTELAPEHPSMACSIIKDAQGATLGLLCLFYRESSTISAFDLTLCNTSSYLCSLVLQRKAYEEHFANPAYRDSLTLLPNRQLLKDRISQAMVHARHHKMDVALMVLDLDRFKHINNSYGHEVGDILLKKVAQRVVNAVGDEFTVARLGGDEFAILVNQADNVDHIADTASHILESLEHPLSIQHHQFYLMGSIGIAMYPHDARDDESLLGCADAAMYQAKAMGRNQFSFYERSLTDSAHEHLTLEHELRHALKNNELTTFYQPQISPINGEIIGVEALARWNHPTRGLTSPNTFILVAEEIGLIDELGAIITEQACLQLKHWHDIGANKVRIAINVSGRQLSIQVIEQLKSIVANIGLSPDVIDFELTESYLMQNAEQSKQLLNSMRDAGFHIAIDDFGIGYSSLAYLKRLPIDKLKIDRMLVKDIAHDPNDEAICRAVIALGHSLGLQVVAEGVESLRQQEFLTEEGCDILQGFKFGKPMSSGDFEKILFAA